LIYVLAIAVWPLGAELLQFLTITACCPGPETFVGLDNYRALWTRRGAQFGRHPRRSSPSVPSLRVLLGLGLALLAVADGVPGVCGAAA